MPVFKSGRNAFNKQDETHINGFLSSSWIRICYSYFLDLENKKSCGGSKFWSKYKLCVTRSNVGIRVFRNQNRMKHISMDSSLRAADQQSGGREGMGRGGGGLGTAENAGCGGARSNNNNVGNGEGGVGGSATESTRGTGGNSAIRTQSAVCWKLEKVSMVLRECFLGEKQRKKDERKIKLRP